ncbi:MAG: prepilin-type N-terminal cleavage/methylation domain-containing protein [Lachnospiraceae bacterium]|nr:prepilin-type N-terminal cleavage/methylation domain-containing protein [Lachnospiraceae bacterium]
MLRRKDSQLNNAGFTLLEVLIAVIILAIVSIPVLRAFVTSANATSKSKLKMYATNAAENIMEDMKTLTKDAIIEKYQPGALPDADGKYVLSITGVEGGTFEAYDDEVNSALGKGFNVEIEIDPTYYENTNGVNLANFDSVSANTAAILNMAQSMTAEGTPGYFSDVYEEKACKEFEKRNEAYRKLYPTADTATALSFSGKLAREIYIDIEKAGTTTDAKGNEIDKISVFATISYILPNNTNKVADDKTSYVAMKKKIYSNASSKTPFRSIFLMYRPNYEMAKSGGDIMIINNPDSVECDLYVVAQNATGSEWESYRKSSGAGLNLQIYENDIEDTENGGTKQPITLRTNLYDRDKLEFTKTSTSQQVPVQCYLRVGGANANPKGKKDVFNNTVWTREKNKKGSFEDADASKEINAQTLEGKTLDASTIEDRLFDVKVTVEKPTTDTEWPVAVELTGTLLE